MRAIQISSFGIPTDVLELIDIPEPPQPDAGQALIGVEFEPINHNDLLLIKGTFHWTPSLPYVVGNEGVGRVLAVGPTVSNVKVGDRSFCRFTATRGRSASWFPHVAWSPFRPKPMCSSRPCCGLIRRPLP
jgi:NADPH:quinone reductase-like Zn-dependent oxidoreductase